MSFFSKDGEKRLRIFNFPWAQPTQTAPVQKRERGGTLISPLLLLFSIYLGDILGSRIYGKRGAVPKKVVRTEDSPKAKVTFRGYVGLFFFFFWGGGVIDGGGWFWLWGAINSLIIKE